MKIEATCKKCKAELVSIVQEAVLGVPIQLIIEPCPNCIGRLKEEIVTQNELIAVLNDNIDYLSDYHDEES